MKKEFDLFMKAKESYLLLIADKLNLHELAFNEDEINSVHHLYQENLDDSKLEQAFYAYCGEAFIKHNGGKWALSTMKKDKAFGTPIIVDWGGQSYPWVRISPLIWANRLKKGNFRGQLSDVILPSSSK